jgi:endonuclease I
MKKSGVLLLFVFCVSQIFAATIWSEDFSSYVSGTGVNGYGSIGDYPSGVSKWSLDVSGAVLTGTGDYLKTVSGKLEACDVDGDAIWISSSINISNFTNVTFKVTISETGDLETTDYADVYYSLNGASYQKIVNWNNFGSTTHTFIGDKPNDYDWQSSTVTKSVPNGNTLRLKIAMKVNAGTEKIQLDNVIVEGVTAAPDYYASISPGLTGSALKQAIHNLIDNHTTFTYASTTANTIMMNADEDPNNPNNLIEIYTGDSENFISSREHVWAKSHGDFGTTKPTGADLHNLKPCQSNVNSTRGNKDFDDGGTEVSSAPGNYHDTDSWEPRDEVKGDIARIIFYMDVRYEGDVSGEPNLVVVNGVDTEDSTISGVYGEHGNLNALLQWHLDDPVDAFEMNRNDVIHQYQKNRNPFIDHPEWVFEIWQLAPEPTEGTIIISELCDPKYNYRYDRFIEICNVGSSAMTLTGWKVVAIGNGVEICTWNLSGSIAAGDALTCGSSSANITMDFPSSTWYGANSSWNGAVNDGAKLLDDGNNIIDIYIADGYKFNDKTLYRNASIIEPSGGTTELSEWTSSTVNYAYLATPGSHVFGRNPNEFIQPVNEVVITSLQNFPNPFNPTTTISFTLPSDCYVNIDIYNSKGQKIRALASRAFSAGLCRQVWDGKTEQQQESASGVYFYRITAENEQSSYTTTKKMILMK